MAPPGGETALDQSDAYPKSPHLSDNRVLYGGAPSGNKSTTNQNAPFHISTNQKLTKNLQIFDISKRHIYYLRLRRSPFMLSSVEERAPISPIRKAGFLVHVSVTSVAFMGAGCLPAAQPPTWRTRDHS